MIIKSVVLNLTNISKTISGLSRYSVNIFLYAFRNKEVTKDYKFIVYVNELGLKQIGEVSLAENLSINIVNKGVSPDFGFYAHLKRLLFTNYLVLKHKNSIIFNPSQLEGVVIPFKKSNKIITVIHDLIPLLFKRGKLYYYFKFFLPVVIKNSDRIITDSNHTKELILKHYSVEENKIRVVYLGVDKKFRPLNLGREKALLYVGRFDKLKNSDGLLRAFELLIKKYNLDHELWLAGSGRLDLKGFDEKLLQRIKVFQDVDDNTLIELYNRAGLFVFPSFYEGFGLPPLEAMACGCPVVVSNAGSLPEVCGEGALYCNPYDPEDIAQAMYKLLTSEKLRSELVKKGLERAKMFSWEKTAEEVLKVIEEVASPSANASG